MDNPNKIKEHLKHQTTGLFTPRLGGIGELEFLKRFQFVGGCLLILHANTNMLRIADFSIFSPTDGIIGTIEIKTMKVDTEQADITAHIVTEYTEVSKKIYEEFTSGYNSSNKQIQQPYIFDRDRFEKQAALQNIFTTIKKTDIINGVKTDLDLTVIENAYKDGISINKEKCLIAFVQKCTKSSFTDRINSNCYKFPSKEKLNEVVANGFYKNNDRKYPTLIGESKPISITPRCAPMFFDNINLEIYKDVLFEKISIYFLLNPTVFLERFEKHGYDIIVNNKTKQISMNKIIQGINVTVDFNFINKLLIERGITVDCVLEIIERIISELEENPNYRIKIEL